MAVGTKSVSVFQMSDRSTYNSIPLPSGSLKYTLLDQVWSMTAPTSIPLARAFDGGAQLVEGCADPEGDVVETELSGLGGHPSAHLGDGKILKLIPVHTEERHVVTETAPDRQAEHIGVEPLGPLAVRDPDCDMTQGLDANAPLFRRFCHECAPLDVARAI